MTNLPLDLWHQLLIGDVILGAALALSLYWVVAGSLVALRRVARNGRIDRSARFSWQIGILLWLEQAYEFTRGQIPHKTDIALLHAYRILDLEWSHGLFFEYRLERFFMRFHALMSAIDLFYVFCHVGVTIGALVWIYTARRNQYPFVRNMLMATTAIALVAFYLYPTAPPRLLYNYGFLDPAQTNHFVDAGGAQVDSYTYNPYAAMPSLHVGYALVVGWGLWVTARRPFLRVFACLYPVVMAAVVIISGNHWVLDVVGAAIIVILARVILLGLSQLQRAVPHRLWGMAP